MPPNRKLLLSLIGLILLYGVTYLFNNQKERNQADIAPEHLAMATKAKLEKGIAPADAIKDRKIIDLASSDSLFIVIYDAAGVCHNSTAKIHGVDPLIPLGALTVSREKRENKITWQPEAGIRAAIVILPWTLNGLDGYVVAGKSLRRTDLRIAARKQRTLISFLATIVVLFVVLFVMKPTQK